MEPQLAQYKCTYSHLLSALNTTLQHYCTAVDFNVFGSNYCLFVFVVRAPKLMNGFWCNIICVVLILLCGFVVWIDFVVVEKVMRLHNLYFTIKLCDLVWNYNQKKTICHAMNNLVWRIYMLGVHIIIIIISATWRPQLNVDLPNDFQINRSKIE